MSGDLISRQAAVYAVDEMSYAFNVKTNAHMAFIKALADLPSAERHGHWKHTRDLYSCPDGNQLFYGKICSVCNNVSPYETPYCMNCGAKMDEGCTPLVTDPILTRQTND